MIHAGDVIGADGLGYSKNDNGVWEKFPHIGGVRIHNNVEIGANSAVNKGTLGNTVIGKGVKIDNLVHIAHNVSIGENSVLCAGTSISGSVKIGTDTWISTQVTIIDRITVGNNVLVGIGSNVIRSLKDNARVFGNPARKTIGNVRGIKK